MFLFNSCFESLLINSLTQFMGIGLTKAKELLKNGLTNINQLRQKKYSALLSKQTKVFLTLRPIKKIPHDDISILEPLLINTTKLMSFGDYTAYHARMEATRHPGAEHCV